MWPTGTLLIPLPDSFEAFEDKDFLEVRCRRCGQTLATFSATGARPEAILEAGGRHRCTVNESHSGHEKLVAVNFARKSLAEEGAMKDDKEMFCPLCDSHSMLQPDGEVYFRSDSRVIRVVKCVDRRPQQHRFLLDDISSGFSLRPIGAEDPDVANMLFVERIGTIASRFLKSLGEPQTKTE